MSADDRRSIDERAELIATRALALATAAVDAGAPWTRRLGTAPTEVKANGLWLLAAVTVAAYRDRYKITSQVPVGGGSKHDAQRVDRQRALAALRSLGPGGSSERSATFQPTAVRAISAP